MAGELKEAISESIKALAKYPLLLLFLVIFLVQSYIQVDKLDKINETLVAIHKDNVKIEDYITEENASTKDYVQQITSMDSKIDLMYENLTARGIIK